ncbi:MAG: peptidoglycan DD-metalloendopeptidase family protein [Blastocatellia bacterium]
MVTFHKITRGQSRNIDRYGSGQFGASRGNRAHHGLDIMARPGESVLSPIDGDVIRESMPYPQDPRYRGLVIRGTGQWDGYEVKMFYVLGILSGQVKAGQIIGTAQDLSGRYPGITNHVHIEVRLRGNLLAPMDMFGICF